MTTISIPSGITKLEEATFAGCANLEGCSIPEGIISIKSRVFEGCSALKSICLPSSVSNIDKNAFKGCLGLEIVKIYNINSWCSIDFQTDWYDEDCANPLYNARNLEVNGSLVKELVIPDGITEIKPISFINCKNLEKIMLPSSVTKIGKRAFYGCSNLVVEVPDTITQIGEGAFYGCKSYIMDKTIDIEWKDVVFASGYLQVPDPFGSRVDIKDENIDETVRSMCRYLKKIIPHLTVHFGRNGEANIVNADELHETVVALQVKNDLAKLIREGKTTTEILKTIDQLSKKQQRIFIPQDKTPYINFLLEKHVTNKYPLVPIVEYIGGSREEGALYTVMIDDQPNIVWENNNDSRASYVFRCTEENYIETRQLVFDFIMAEVSKKRRYLNSKECTTIFKEKPRMVVHSNLKSWAQRLMCDPNLVVELEAPIYKTAVSIEDTEGELGDLSYQGYDVSTNASVKADYFKICDGKRQLLLSCTFNVYDTIYGEFEGDMSEWDMEDFGDDGEVDGIVSQLNINDFNGLSNLDLFALGVPTSGDGLSSEDIGTAIANALNTSGIEWSSGEFECTKLFSDDAPSGYFDN